MYNTLFTYTNDDILLTNGITFTVLLGPEWRMQVIECPVAVLPVISKYEGCYALLTASTSPNWHQIQPGKMWEKVQNTSLPSVMRWLQGEKGNIDWVLNLKYFVQTATFRWPTVAPLRGHSRPRWEILRILNTTNWNSFRCHLSVGSLRGHSVQV
jgi:hypothetical protein